MKSSHPLLFPDLDAVDPAAVDDRVRDLAARLPPPIHLGTLSWSLPGWTGLVYAARNGKPASEQTLARHGLAAHAAHPLLRTVSLDRTFYAPLTAPDFAPALRDAGGVPCLAVHARMPPVAEQATAFGLAAAECASPLVVRWNLHAGRGYDEAKADYFPFNRLIEEDPASRHALATLARQAAATDRDTFITINNKAEGSAPLSVLKRATAIVVARR